MDDLMEYEPTPILYIVELDRNDITMLVNAAMRLAQSSAVGQAESEAYEGAAGRLAKQAANL